jgi:hypothetical protein
VIDHSIYWHLPPLVLAVSFVYAATRHEDWPKIFWRTLYWVQYIVSFLLMAGVAIEAMGYFGRDSWKPAAVLLAVWALVKVYRFANRSKSAKDADPTSADSQARVKTNATS